MSAKTSGRIVGCMLLLAFVFYGGGSALTSSVTGEPVVLAQIVGHESRLGVGVLLMLLNSAAVTVIGVAAYPVLKRHHPTTAFTYLLTRGFEAALLGVGSVLLLALVPLAHYSDSSREPSPSRVATAVQDVSLGGYWVAMIVLSLGSLLFCRALFHARLAPRALAVWGFAGYALLAAGGVLELLGHGVGIWLASPGGAFEAALGILLVVKGFPDVQAQDQQPVSPTRERTGALPVRRPPRAAGEALPAGRPS